MNQEPEAADVLRPSVGRFSLTDHEIIIHGEVCFFLQDFQET